MGGKTLALVANHWKIPRTQSQERVGEDQRARAGAGEAGANSDASGRRAVGPSGAGEAT